MVESAPPQPVDGGVVSAAQARGLDEASVKRGHDLFAWHCVQCHSPVAPWALSEQEWDKILPRMFKKADLEDQEAHDVRAYIFAVRDSHPPAPPKAKTP